GRVRDQNNGREQDKILQGVSGSTLGTSRQRCRCRQVVPIAHGEQRALQGPSLGSNHARPHKGQPGQDGHVSHQRQCVVGHASLPIVIVVRCRSSQQNDVPFRQLLST